MCRRHKEIFNVIFFNGLHSLDSFSSTVLTLKVITCHTFDVTHMSHCDHRIFNRDQIFHGNVKFVKTNGCTTIIAIFISN